MTEAETSKKKSLEEVEEEGASHTSESSKAHAAVSPQPRPGSTQDKRTKTGRHVPFGKMAMQLKMVDQDQLNDALLSSVTDQKGKRLGEIMVEMGYMSAKQVEKVLLRQREESLGKPTASLEEDPLLTSYMIQIGEEGWFPALGYNQLDSRLKDLRYKYEIEKEIPPSQSVFEILHNCGFTQITQVSQEKNRSSYMGISKKSHELTFIKYSRLDPIIYTFYLELFAFLATRGIAHIHQIEQLIRIKGHGALLVQKFIRGESLGNLIRKRGVFAVDEALYIAQQLVDILVQIHSRGVLHFDIKPQNIVIIANTLETYLLDFGCSVYIGDRKAITYEEMGVAKDSIFGTPSYMAYEQITQQKITRAVDQVPVGCLLYRMITGRKLFSGATLQEIMKNKIDGVTERDLNELDAIPDPVREIITKTISAQPEERYLNMRHLSHAIMESRLALDNNRYQQDLL